MSIEKSLELLDMSRKFVVKRGDDGYSVGFKDDGSDHPLSALYADGKGWSYFIGDTYNCGYDWVRIDVGRLKALESFCESLGGEAR